ncbi:MAG: hypothetical protein ACYCZF_06060 [Anaerolineae bacterium]
MTEKNIKATRYSTEHGAITGRNQECFANRSIYCNNSDTWIMAGDKPLVRFGKGRRVLGALEIGMETTKGVKLIYDCDDITFRYKAGLVTWEVRDSSFEGDIMLAVGAPEHSDAMIVRLSASQPLSLRWRYGGLAYIEGGNWSIDPAVEPEWRSMAFNEALCDHNAVMVVDERFAITNYKMWEGQNCKQVVGMCSAPGYQVQGDPNPYVAGSITEVPDDIYWGFYLVDEVLPARDLAIDLTAAFKSAVTRSEYLSSRVAAHTPEPLLDTLVGVVAGEVDGAWYPPFNVHSTLSWNSPYLGWCNRFGNTYCGWHDRLLAEVAHYAPLQVTDDTKRGMMNDPARKLTVAHPDSRFYGLGHVNAHQYFYDMQSQFFDQAIHGWYATGDETLKEILRPALELHTRWMDDCFDPDQDGIYESYINSWPTDSVWYNGGGSPEETCYALRAHQAAMEMALLDGDTACAERHQRIVERIKKGFIDLLWIADKGYAGKYREQGGHKRLHENPWTYAIFLPIDVGLLDPQQSVQSLYYTQWALENVRMPYGGRKVWMSNWVPSIWSVREFTPGENFQLAYAYFKAGFPEEGYDILKGTMVSAGYDTLYPGRISSEGGSLFYRAVVEGLFGYLPDYPHGKVVLAPQLPAYWEHAAINSPDFALAYDKSGNTITLDFSLAQAAAVTINLPVYSARILSVQGCEEYRVLPHFGRQIVQIDTGKVDHGRLIIETAQPVGLIQPITLQAAPLGTITLAARGRITAIYDPQGITLSHDILDGQSMVKLADKSGYHVLFADMELDGAAYKQIFYLELAKTADELVYEAKLHCTIPDEPRWQQVDISTYLNGDIRTIYQQRYLSPRPATISARIGSDGYSPWTFTFWGNEAPEITLDQVPGLLNADSEITSPSGVPFTWPVGANNIAFTSLWDNWPDKVTVPVDSCGQAIWLHLCGTTNPMQCGISNAVVRFVYADGVEEQLQLINPDNFWSLCPLYAQATAKGQGSHTDYSYEFDSFCLPKTPPETIQLGENCRSVVACFTLRPGVQLKSVTLEALSQEVVIGLMGMTLLE